MTKNVEISRVVKAPPEKVWAAISDVTRMGEWSPECYACEWQDGATGPAVGARFRGHNRHGDKEWSTDAEVTECVPGSRFAFDGVFGDLRFAKWGYTIEPHPEGSLVTETWEDGRPESILDMTAQITGVQDRGEHNRKNMEETLARLAAAVE